MTTTYFAIGDIHGRDDLLEQLLPELEAKAKVIPGRKELIFLGDYIDRGPHSRQVIERILNTDFSWVDEVVYLRGNHEQYCLDFFEHPAVYVHWSKYGGEAFMGSYGICERDAVGARKMPEDLQDEFIETFSDEHRSFMEQTVLMHRGGEYTFVHAGIRPGVDLDKQDQHDLIGIRQQFYAAPVTTWEGTVVFGHTVFPEVYNVPGRLGLDTGAFATGKLTAAIMRPGDNEVQLLQTTFDGPMWSNIELKN